MYAVRKYKAFVYRFFYYYWVNRRVLLAPYSIQVEFFFFHIIVSVLREIYLVYLYTHWVGSLRNVELIFNYTTQHIAYLIDKLNNFPDNSTLWNCLFFFCVLYLNKFITYIDMTEYIHSLAVCLMRFVQWIWREKVCPSWNHKGFYWFTDSSSSVSTVLYIIVIRYPQP